jgi:hypothetical protein
MSAIIIVNLLKIVIALCNIYLILLFIMGILSLLSLFGVVDINSSSSIAGRVYGIVRAFISPILNSIARFIPNIGLLDLRFLAFLFALWIIKDLCNYWIIKISATIFSF